MDFTRASVWVDPDYCPPNDDKTFRVDLPNKDVFVIVYLPGAVGLNGSEVGGEYGDYEEFEK